MSAELQEARELWQQGRLEETAAWCRMWLAREPRDVQALNLLAAACARLQRHGEAIDAIAQAVALQPGDAVLQNNLGNALRAAGKPDSAVAAYRTALNIEPRYADAAYNLGLALADTGDMAAAIEAYRQALQLNPSHVAAHYNLGNCLRHAGRPSEAAESFKRALALAPDLVPALNNLGTVLQEGGHLAEASACFQRALSVDPKFTPAYVSLAAVYSDTGRASEAIGVLQRAVALDPDHALAHYSLANAFCQAGLLDAAVESYTRALTLSPGLMAAAAELVMTQLRRCDWSQLSERTAQLCAAVEANEILSPYVLMYVSDDPALQQRAARRWSRVHAVDTPPLWRGEVYRHDRIRLAYLSADFRSHPVGTSIVELLERHDRRRFEVILVSLSGAIADETARRLRDAADRWVDTERMTAADAAEWLRREEVDVAIDLMGHSARSRQRIFAHRPTPVAVAYLGYPGTVGAPWIDYLIADPFVVPSGHESHYDERIVRVEGTFMPADTTLQPAMNRRRADEGLPDDALVLCCLNHPAKITPILFDVWLRVLEHVDSAVLWLQASAPAAHERLARHAAAHGVEAARIVFAARVPAREDYLARLRLADLFLDTYPYGAHSTARDALWSGLPVLTYSGRSFAARVSGGLLRAAGLGEFIAHSIEEYADLLLRLAREPEVLRAARQHLDSLRLKGELFPVRSLCGELEDLYEWMVRRRGPRSPRPGHLQRA